MELLRIVCYFVMGYAVRTIVLQLQLAQARRKVDEALVELDNAFAVALADAEAVERALHELQVADYATGTPIGAALAREMGIELPLDNSNE